ncbi:MAG: V4R domain-containing protein [Candidatus Hodarchaeota archaeon]
MSSEKERLEKVKRASFKESKFFEGSIKGFNHRLVIMINEQFSGFYESLKNLGLKNAGDIIRKFGYDLALKMSQRISDRILDEKIGLEYFLTMLNKAGFGKFWHLNFTDENITVELHNSPEAYEKAHHSCYYIAGILEGAGEHYFKEKTKVIEKSCISKGDRFCEFLIMKRSKFDKEVPKLAELELILKDFDKTAKSKGSLIIDYNGNILIHSIQKDIDIDNFSILISTVLTSCNAASSYLTGEYIQTIINCSEGNMMTLPAKDKAFLVAILDKHSSPNLIGIAMKQAIEKILKAL